MNPLLYELPIIEHVDAKSVEEALSLLRRYGEKARVMAGGKRKGIESFFELSSECQMLMLAPFIRVKA